MKGQIWAFDFLIAVAFLLLVFVLSYLVWNITVIRGESELDYVSMRLVAAVFSDSLLLRDGDPDGWEYASSINAIGLVNENGVLDEDKLKKLNSTNYSVARRIMGLGKYNYFINITNTSDGNTLYEIGNKTIEVEKVVVERFALLNGDVVSIVFEVWKE